MPLFSIVRKQFEQLGGWRRVYYERLQWLLFPFALAANAINFEFTGWRYVVRSVRSPGTRKAAHLWDMAALVGHWVLWLVVPMLFFPISHVLAFYVVRMSLLGYAMFAVLAPGHYPAEAICLTEDHREKGYVLRQAATCLNFRTGPIGRFLCSGLQYQIEHHLFPGLSHNFYPKLAVLMEEYFRKQGYPYRTLGWDEAIWKSFEVFRVPQAVHTSVRESGLSQT